MAGRLLVSFFICALIVGCGQSDRAPDPVAAGSNDALDPLMQDWIAATSDGDPIAVSDSASQPTSVAPVSDLLSGLEARLNANPDDVSGWRLLAQSYAHVGRWDDAQAAAARAVELGADADELQAAILAAHTSTAY